MRGKSLALLIVSLGCGLVASLGITQVLAKRGDSTPTDTTPVYVATADIGIGSVASEENVKVEQWPKDKVPAGALVRMEDLDGRRARQKIYAGEPIIEPKLLTRGQVPTDSTVPKGLRVIAIPVSYEAIQGGLVLPGRGATCRSSSSRILATASPRPSARRSCKTFASLPSMTSRAPTPWIPEPRREVIALGQDGFLAGHSKSGPDRDLGQPDGHDPPGVAERRG